MVEPLARPHASLGFICHPLISPGSQERWAACANPAPLILSQGSGFMEAYFLIFGSQWLESWDPVISPVGSHPLSACFCFLYREVDNWFGFLLWKPAGSGPVCLSDCKANPSSPTAVPHGGLCRCSSFNGRNFSLPSLPHSPSTWPLPVQWFSAGSNFGLQGNSDSVLRHFDGDGWSVVGGAASI